LRPGHRLVPAGNVGPLPTRPNTMKTAKYPRKYKRKAQKPVGLGNQAKPRPPHAPPLCLSASSRPAGASPAISNNHEKKETRVVRKLHRPTPRWSFSGPPPPHRGEFPGPVTTSSTPNLFPPTQIRPSPPPPPPRPPPPPPCPLRGGAPPNNSLACPPPANYCFSMVLGPAELTPPASRTRRPRPA